MAVEKVYDERTLLAQLASGSEAAFEQIFHRYSPKIYQTALKFLKSEYAAEEVVQDIFLDIWLRREKMNLVLNLGAYLQGMVKKQVYDAFRRKTTFADLIAELKNQTSSSNPTEQLITEREYEDWLSTVIAKLPKHQQEIFHLSRQQELNQQQIAQQLNMTQLAVQSHMKRILAFLRSQLAAFLKVYLLAILFIFVVK